MRTVLELSDEIGPRPAGTAAEAQAADALERRLVDLGLQVDRHSFAFRGWRQTGRSGVQVDGDDDEIAGVAFPYTEATGSHGISGALLYKGLWPIIPERLVCPRFAVTDSGGRTLGHILGSPFGEARPLPNPLPLLTEPTVVIGSTAADELHQLTQTSRHPPHATLIVESVWQGTLESTNLISTLGSSRRRMLLVAHYDSVAGSPGANDNASGVALLLRIVERLRSDPLDDLGVQILLAAAEEPFLVGARAYGVQLATTGELPQIRACLNFDMVGVGERLSLRCEPGSIWSRAADADHNELTTDDMMASSDHWAFHELGVPSAQLTRVPDPAWHTADDSHDRVSDVALAEAESTAIALLETASELIAGDQTEHSGVR